MCGGGGRGREKGKGERKGGRWMERGERRGEPQEGGGKGGCTVGKKRVKGGVELECRESRGVKPPVDWVADGNEDSRVKTTRRCCVRDRAPRIRRAMDIERREI